MKCQFNIRVSRHYDAIYVGIFELQKNNRAVNAARLGVNHPPLVFTKQETKR